MKIKVDFENRTIVVAKAFMKRASVYGSDEYKSLMDILEKHDGFTVEVKKAPRKSNHNRGLTYENMEIYVRANDESGKLIEEFQDLIDWEEPYGTIYSWFISHFPEKDMAKSQKQRRDEILNAISEKKVQEAVNEKKRLDEERNARIAAAVARIKAA